MMFEFNMLPKIVMLHPSAPRIGCVAPLQGRAPKTGVDNDDLAQPATAFPITFLGIRSQHRVVLLQDQTSALQGLVGISFSGANIQ